MQDLDVNIERNHVFQAACNILKLAGLSRGADIAV